MMNPEAGKIPSAKEFNQIRLRSKSWEYLERFKECWTVTHLRRALCEGCLRLIVCARKKSKKQMGCGTTGAGAREAVKQLFDNCLWQ